LKLNVAVIGCGSWGRNHARVYSELENANLVAVSDIVEASAKTIGERYHTDWCCDVEKVFDNPEVDAVSICTPTVTHAECGLKAIEAGKHVLVEKPMTDTVQEAEALIDLAKKQGVTLSVGFIERFNPAVREAIKMISDGKIGDLIQVHAKRVSRWPRRIGDVGVIKDLAIHDIDVSNYLFQDGPLSVYANAGNIKHKFEDYSNIMINYPDNRGAFLETNWLTPRKVRNLVITGTQGIITVEYINQTVTLENETALYQPYIQNDEPLKLELTSFVDSILHGKKPYVTGEDGLKALRVCEGAIQSAKTGQPVIL